jgi:RNA polymerase sigma-70 factor (ECF subfamily)
VDDVMTPFARRGADLADIEAVYRLQFARFCAVATAILRDRETARDAVQDAFATAVRDRREYRREGPLEAWLWRVVVNTALTERRRRVTHPTSEPARNGTADDETALDDVRAAIQSLPERQRLVVFLRYWADLDYLAIADVLAVAPGTVGAALNAAHRSVRNRLQEVRT